VPGRPQGRVPGIPSGPQFIHALFHLDHPSVRGMVRNYYDEGAPPQMGYAPPGIGIDDALADPRLLRPLELYRMLVDVGRVRDAEQIVRGIVGGKDLMAVFLTLAAIGDTDAERPIAERVRARAHTRHGAVVDTMTAAIANEAEARRFTLLRSRVTDPDLRFFLALLLVVPTPAALRRLVAERVPGQDVALTMHRWLTALAGMNALTFSLDAVQLRLLAHMMQGRTFAEILPIIAREDGRPVTAAQRTHLRAVHQAITTAPYLDRLVARVPAVTTPRRRAR